jgi:DNA segregation ATPase FtsK/SpoIIIE-like protein
VSFVIKIPVWQESHPVGEQEAENVASNNTTTNKKKKTTGTRASGVQKKAPALQEEVQQEDSGFIRAEVGIIASFALAVILFLSNFHLCGALGDVLRQVQLGLFGFLGFILPLLLFVGTTFYMSNRGNFAAMRKLAASIVLAFVLCGFAQLFFGAQPEDGAGIVAFYNASSVNGGGGGLAGGLICLALKSILGNVGAFIVLTVLLIISVVCITEKSLVKVVKKHSDTVYQYAREDMAMRREINEEKRAIREEERAVRAEERRRQREERIRGVNISSTDLSMDSILDREIPEMPQEQEPVKKQSPAAVMRAAAESVHKATAESTASAEPEQEKVQDPADVFTGSISMPEEYKQADEDTAPFEEDTVLSPSESAQRLVDDGVTHYHDMDEAFDEPAGPIPMAEDLAGIREIPIALTPAPEAPAEHTYREPVSMSGYAQHDSFLDEEISGQYQPEITVLPAEEEEIYLDEIPVPEADIPALETSRYSDMEDMGNTETMGNMGTIGNMETMGYTGTMENTGTMDDMEAMGYTENTEDSVQQEADIPFNRMDYEMLPDPDPDAAAPGAAAYASLRTATPAGSISGGGRVAGEVPDEIDHVKKTTQNGVFYVPGGEKRVETASGKIIDTDTEALQKKLESARREAKEATGEAQVADIIKEKEEVPKREYVFPPLNLLKKGTRPVNTHSEQEYRETAIKLQQTLKTFGVGVTVTNISCGPTVTRYELHPEMGVKVSKIVGLADDIKLSLAAADIRIEAPIPGKSAVGIEVPNKENSMVHLRDLFEAENFKNHPSTLAFAVGKDIGGQVVVTDIAKMPHLLIAGQTGSGKSVCINTLIMSIIYKSKPEDVKLILVDPKVVELSIYNGIPHLLIPVVTDPKKAAGALNWAVAEMTDRYKKFAQYGVRDIKGYNAKVESIKDIEDDKKPQKMPKIVIIIDELADLMMVASNEVEDAICRLAQLARACGIHLVIATQRPSVNVITGLIKANVPSRIAFSVASGVDSRTIIDMYGAEKLLGHGDMLFYPAGYPKPQRVQGAFVSDEEVQAVCDFLNDQGMTAQFDTEIEKQMNAAPAAAAGAAGGARDGRDEYFADAGRFIIEKEKASIGMLQRVFKIGFNRAARIMDQLADAGVVGEEEGTKPRKVLMTMEEFETFLSLGE